MPEEYTMEIDATYPYGPDQKKGREPSAAGTEKDEQKDEKKQGEISAEQTEPEKEVKTEQKEEPKPDPSQIPLHVLQAIRQENQVLKQKIEDLEKRGAKAPSKDEGEPFKGYDDDDVVTVADMKKMLNMRPSQTGEGQMTAPTWTPGDIPVMESYMRMEYPDYDQVIQQLPTLTSQNPLLIEEIKRSSNPPLIAYSLAKGLAKPKDIAKADSGQKGREAAEKVLRNLEKPGTAGAAAGGGAISQAGHYAGMNDDELERRIAAVKRGG